MTIPNDPKKEDEDSSLTLPPPSTPPMATPPVTPALTLPESTALPPANVDSTPLGLSRPTVAEQEGLAPPKKGTGQPTTDVFRKRVEFQDILIALGSSVIGALVIYGVSSLLQLVLQGTLAEMNAAIQLPLVVALLGGVAFFVTLGLGIWQRLLGFVAALVTGILVALVLYAVWQANGGVEVDGPTRLLYGIPGIVTAIGMSALGGWIGAQLRIALGAPAALSVPAKVGMGAMVIWAVGELIARVAGAFVFVPSLQTTLAPIILPIAIAFPLLTGVIVFLGYRGGITKEEWRYRWNGVNVALGGVIGLVLFAVTYFLTARLDAGLFGALATATTTTLENAITASPEWWWRLAYVAVVGLLVPITEGWVWRGIVHTGLTRGMGQVTGYIVTALAYVLKYLLVSLSIANLITLLVIALVLGLVRSRVGTGASTVAHIVSNTLTAILVLL